jgi:NADPH:quinone reductase-like Zn-dependent oxidoreductase
MKTIQFGHYGEPKEVVKVTDRAIPEPGEYEVRVRVALSPMNPSDLLCVRGRYSGVTPVFPAPAGFEGVGIFDALGSGVHHLAVGQRVICRNSQGGNWAEYAVIPAVKAYAAPDDIPDE